MSNGQSSSKMAPKGLGCDSVTFRPKVCGQIMKHARLLPAFAPSLSVTLAWNIQVGHQQMMYLLCLGRLEVPVTDRQAE